MAREGVDGVRLADVAREAGVSLATVDRVVNDRSGVRPHTAERVREVLARLRGAGTAPSRGRMLRPLVFDVILPAGTNTFLRNLHDALLTAATVAPEPVTIRPTLVEGFDPAALAARMLAVGPGSDGVALVALEHPAVRGAVDQLAAQGVPVFTLVSDLSSIARVGYVGVDNRAAGRTAGYLMSRFLPDRAGGVAIVAGSLSYRGHEEREIGFRHLLRGAAPRLDIVAVVEAHDDVETTRRRSGELLDRHPDLLGIYSIGGGNRGIAEALVERERDQRTVFIGHELTRFSRQFLIDGVMDAVIDQDFRHEAASLVRMMVNHAAGRPAEDGITPTRVEIYVRENLP